ALVGGRTSLRVPRRRARPCPALAETAPPVGGRLNRGPGGGGGAGRERFLVVGPDPGCDREGGRAIPDPRPGAVRSREVRAGPGGGQAGRGPARQRRHRVVAAARAGDTGGPGD